MNVKSIYFEITNACNLKCDYCCINANDGKNIYLDKNIIFGIVNEAIKLGCNTIMLSGGEPLLHPDLWDIIDLLTEKKLNVFLVTNGTMITENIAKKLSKYNMTIQISIDGAESTYHDMFRGKGSFDAAIRGIKLLNENCANNKINVKTVLTNKNYTQIEGLCVMCRRLNVNQLSFSFINAQGRAVSNYDDNSINTELRKSIYYKVLNLKEKYKDKPTIGELSTDEGCLFAKEDKPSINLKISYNGDVFPCQMFVEKIFSIGNIYKNNLNEIFNGEQFNNLCELLRLRRYHFIDKCSTCFVKAACQRTCPALAYQKFGNILSVDESICEIKRYISLHQLEDKKIV